ncbi:hypothetical protein [Rubrivirga sp. SAORIC476]|uniref:hypothetical protein n=1 Tax=Rubrivirga sp. SAORIC476 TaxID=1961794 RepID=UPI00117ABED8|nr:hypothetical protein [Rubrivirga sp. SAORIC476]
MEKKTPPPESSGRRRGDVVRHKEGPSIIDPRALVPTAQRVLRTFEVRESAKMLQSVMAVVVIASRVIGTVRVLSKDRAMTARTNAQGLSWDSPSLGEKLGRYGKNDGPYTDCRTDGCKSICPASTPGRSNWSGHGRDARTILRPDLHPNP